MAKRRKTDSEQVISTTVGIIPGGQPVAPPFSQSGAVRAYSSWIYAATVINANAVASIPLRLYAKADAGRKKFGWWKGRKVPPKRKRYLLGDARTQPHPTVRKSAMESSDFVELADHPALALLSQVNPWTAGFDHLRLTAIYLQATGNAYWYADRSGVGGVPSQIIQLMPQWTEILPDRGTFIKGYLYGRNRGEAVALDTEEVVHFKLPNPGNAFYGKGWYEAAWAAINQNVAVHEMDLAFFQNFARPDYLVTVQGGGSEGALARFQQDIEAQVKGTKKVGRLLAATGQVQITPLNFQPKDMNGRDEMVEEISAISGCPVSMLKANDPNLASAESGFRQWRESTIAPFCRSVEDVLNQLYLPMWDISEDAFFAFDDPVPENEDAESIRVDRMLKNGSMTLNEARGEEGYDEYETPLADQPLFNGQPLGMLSSIIEGVPAGDAPAVAEPVAEQPNATPNATPPTDNPTAQAATDPNAAVQDTALNGAQVTALVDLIVQAREGVIPVDAAQAIAAAAFPLMTPEQLAAIFNPVRSAPPLPKPEPVAQQPANNPNSTGNQPEAKAKEATHSASGFRVSQQEFLYGVKGCTCHACHDKAADPLEAMNDKKVREFVASLEPILRAQAEAVIAMLEARGTPTADILDEAVRIIQQDRWVQQIRSVSKPYIADQVVSGAQTGVRLLPPRLAESVRFEFTNPSVSRFVDSATVRLASTINETTAYDMRQVLGDSLERGLTTQETANEVQNRLGVTAPRAETIARTESARAYVQGQEEAWKQSGGVVTGKKWLIAPDACEFCRAASRLYSEKATPLGQPFFRKGETLTGVSGGTLVLDYSDVDGPPLHPNDRCSIVPVLEGEQ